MTGAHNVGVTQSSFIGVQRLHPLIPPHQALAVVTSLLVSPLFCLFWDALYLGLCSTKLLWVDLSLSLAHLTFFCLVFRTQQLIAYSCPAVFHHHPYNTSYLFPLPLKETVLACKLLATRNKEVTHICGQVFVWVCFWAVLGEYLSVQLLDCGHEAPVV